MEYERPKLELKREVQPPQRSSNGLAVVVVASMAMLFALASSAFMLRARMMHCRDAARAVQVVEVKVIAPAVPAAHACGEPHVVDNADGTQTVRFEACASPALVTVDGAAQAYATPLPEHTRLAVPPLP